MASQTILNNKPDTVLLSNLKAGVVKIDITPIEKIPLGGYEDRKGPFTGIHDPLYAVVAVFDDGINRAAIVSLDTVQVLQAEGDALKQAVKASASVSKTCCIINASHTHGAPWLYINEDYRKYVISRVAQAAEAAADCLKNVSIGYGEGVIDFNINRRCIDAEGKCSSGMNPDGVCDHRVKILRIDDGDSVEPMAVIMHAVCHANVFRGSNTEVTADFPGLAKSFVERNFGSRTVAMFLQGCEGDSRANLPGIGIPDDGFGRSGSDTDMIWCARTLGAEAVKTASRLRVREFVAGRDTNYKISCASETVILEADESRIAHERERVVNGQSRYPITVIRVGGIWFVTLPGEPVVEYGLQIEKSMEGLGKVFVLGCAEGDIGYVPVGHMYAEGGYEAAGPLKPSSEQRILEAVQRLVAAAKD